MHTRVSSWVTASAASILLAACGGGSSGLPDAGASTPSPDASGPVVPPPASACSFCSAGMLAGVAAAGAAMTDAWVLVHDAAGVERRAVIAEDGRYTVDVSGLTGPFILQATGRLGGVATLLHGVAVADDVGKRAVNLTPLTEVIAANTVCDDPAHAFNTFAEHASSVTAASVKSAEDKLMLSLAQVSDAFGVGGKNLRTSEFKVGDTGIDAMIDALRVSANYPETGVPQHHIEPVGNAGDHIQIDRCGAPGAALAYDAKAREALASSQAALAEITALLQQFTAAFAHGSPDSDTLRPLFHDNFLHNGLNLNDWITKVLLDLSDPDPTRPDYVGLQLGAPRIVSSNGKDLVLISTEMRFKSPNPPESLLLYFGKSNGKWLIRGNQDFAKSSVTLHARLTSTPLSEAEVAALPNVRSFVPEWDSAHTYYEQSIAGAPGLLWLGHMGEDYFGLIGWAGQDFDDPATPINEREVRRDWNSYFGKPDTRILRYLAFNIDDRSSRPSAVRTVVTGPGLPEGGLTLTRHIPDVDGNFWTLTGDPWNWNTFSTERCAQVARPAYPPENDLRPAIPDCALDWNKVHRGSRYKFEYFDAGGAAVGVDYRELKIDPSLAVLENKRDALFPRLQTTPGTEFTVKNISDDRSTSAFLDGASLTLAWAAPGDKQVKVSSIHFNREISHPAGMIIEQSDYVPLYGLPDTQHSFAIRSAPAGYLSNWAYVTLLATDAFGNVFDHELSPYNPR